MTEATEIGGTRERERTVVNTADLTMTQIKSSVLEEMTPGKAIDPLTLIEQLHKTTEISLYDLKAALWYLIGDRSIQFNDHLDVVKTDQAAST